jgi:hypothetical protein
MHSEIIQVLIELRFAPDKISSLCQVPEDSLVGLLPADFSPIEISNRNIELEVPSLFTKVAALYEQSQLPYSSYITYRNSSHRPYSSTSGTGRNELDAKYESVLLGLAEGRVLPNGDVYEGEVVDHLPNGQGTYRYSEDDRICVGSWVNGQMQGQGEITWPNGKQLHGHFESNSPVGECKVAWADGRTYEGSLTANYELTGLGTLRMPKIARRVPEFMKSLDLVMCGSSRAKNISVEDMIRSGIPMSNGDLYDIHSSEYVYVGHFIEGRMQGHGVVITPIGMYEGEWQQDLFHGQGTCINFSGMEYYTGTWHRGLMHGFGISNSYEGLWHKGDKCGIGQDSQYTGEFKNDSYAGYGVLVNSEGKYDGEFERGYKQRYGVMCFAYGERYEGNWRRNAIYGEGTFYLQSGRAYAEYYSQGRGTFYGHLTDGDGNIYRGELLGGLPHGSGKLFYPDFTLKYEGSWVNGKMHGYGIETLRMCSRERNEGQWYQGLHTGQVVSPGEHYEGNWESGLKHGLGTWRHMGEEYTGSWHSNNKQGRGIYTWSNGDSYEGSWCMNKRTGYGTMKYHTGEVYVGSWTINMRSGEGSLTCPDGSVWTGTWRGDRFYSNEQLTLANGDLYEGELINKVPNGTGTLTCAATGAKYEGKWAYGRRHGKGTFKTLNGEWCYQGDWKADRREGQGSCKFPGEEVYEGQWCLNQQNGQGSMLWPDGTKYEGQWLNGKMNGTGTCTWSDGRVFTGIFKEGRKYSTGEVEMPNGDQYDGQMLDEVPNGRGKMTYIKTGDKCEGRWVEGRRTGYGRVTYASGDVFSGQWKDDVKQGKGTYEFADGRVLSGLWQNDQAHGECTMRLPSRESYSGRWEAGALVGEVEYRWTNGRVFMGDIAGMQGLSFSRLKIDFETYLGSTFDAQPHGLGSLSYQDRTPNYGVSGFWLNSKIEGYAEKTLANGEWYKGWWRDNKLHGQGSYGWLDCTVYSGHWENNMRTGTGVMKLSDGSRYEGEWYEDQLLETTAQVHKDHWATVYLKQVDDRIYHSNDKPRRQFINPQSYQEYAENFSRDRKRSPCLDDDSTWSDWEDED